MAYKYAYNEYDKESMARSNGQNLSISLKKAVETLREIRGKKVSFAIKYLEGVINKETVVPYRRYRAEMAHKKGKGIDTGGFPVSVAKEVLRLLKSAQKNALEKELSEENLYVISASARKGPSRYHYGRYSGRKMKSTNVEIVVGERDKK
jgi:large subunit ribosomal protein L22